MKNKKIFGKKQLVMAGLIAALGAAVWLNMEYSSGAGGFLKTGETSSAVKNLGDTKYVMTESDPSAAETAAAAADYFTSARADREKARNEAVTLLEETTENTSADEKAKSDAAAKIKEIAARIEREVSIETLIKAKGFEDAVVIIGDSDVNVVVKSDELLQSQTLQIQDAVTSQLEISLEKIKIVNRK